MQMQTVTKKDFSRPNEFSEIDILYSRIARCVCVCVCVCARACVRACVRVCVWRCLIVGFVAHFLLSLQ